jgi:hypothetical protein
MMASIKMTGSARPDSITQMAFVDIIQQKMIKTIKATIFMMVFFMLAPVLKNPHSRSGQRIISK